MEKHDTEGTYDGEKWIITCALCKYRRYVWDTDDWDLVEVGEIGAHFYSENPRLRPFEEFLDGLDG